MKIRLVTLELITAATFGAGILLFGACGGARFPLRLPEGAEVKFRHEMPGLTGHLILLVAEFPRSEVDAYVRTPPLDKAQTSTSTNFAIWQSVHVAGWSPQTCKSYVSGKIRLSDYDGVSFTIGLDDPNKATGYFVWYSGN